MTRGGNDIVSLQAINRTRTRQPRFYSKILADSELTLYKEGGFAAIPFEIFVWLCWSIKESAFKYLHTLFSRSLVYHELIHSVVLDQENFENTRWGIKLIDQPDPENQSMEVRKFLVDRLESLFPASKLRIGKNAQGFIVVLQGEEEVGISVSLSHHDRMVAYAFSGSSTRRSSLIDNA